MAFPGGSTEADSIGEGLYEQIYLILAGLFVASLVACNLIFLKFFGVSLRLPGGEFEFEQSVGLIPYPVTFLITDILSEVYGKRRANQVVTAGLFSSVFVVLMVLAADAVPATGWSPVGDAMFHQVFGLNWIAVTASMMAYLGAQFLDIRLFHFWRRVTGGRHLWLRNNASTICSQVVDTFMVLVLLAALGSGTVTWERLPRLFWNGALFKMGMALLDTPLFYIATAAFKRWFPRQLALAHS